jgi:hypothetical protein
MDNPPPGAMMQRPQSAAAGFQISTEFFAVHRISARLFNLFPCLFWLGALNLA